jgi:ferredoxin
MSVLINDNCICCGSCIKKCPVNAIVDDKNNPLNIDIFHVLENKCIECIDYFEVPACANVCPTEGCITWTISKNNAIKIRKDVSEEKRKNKTPVIDFSNINVDI